MTGPSILIAGVVRQECLVLEEHLRSLADLDGDGLDLCFFFVDANVDPDSSRLLADFGAQTDRRVIVRKARLEDADQKTETLPWPERARLKDEILEFALARDAHVFMVEPDLALHPWVLQQLWACGREIVAELFWTRADPGQPWLPQVWVSGQYTLLPHERGEMLDQAQISYRISGFLHMLHQPGLYEVGGLGGCALIRHDAIRRGVRYREIPNLELAGEDRHFSVRAAVLGIGLHVDTNLIAYHLGSASGLSGLEEYRKQCRLSTARSIADGAHPSILPPPKTLAEIRRVRKEKNRLTLVLAVRNEADRYLARMLRQARQFVDDAVVVDGRSTDGTPEMVRDLLTEAHVPLKMQTDADQGMNDEISLRKQAWHLATEDDPDWLLLLDADEILEDRAFVELRRLLQDPRWDSYAFRLYDFWDEEHYREDQYWQAHLRYQPFLVRYQPEFPYEWHEQPLHCGRVPKNLTALPGTTSALRIKHLGWMNPQDRQHRYETYISRDPTGRYGLLEHYRSILAPEPRLVRWVE